MKRWESQKWNGQVSKPAHTLEIDCREVLRALVGYVEDDLTSELRAKVERHLRTCRHCTAIYDGVHNIIQLVGDERLIELPAGFSRRLLSRLRQSSGK
jgi:anti-sigma factor RsiW